MALVLIVPEVWPIRSVAVGVAETLPPTRVRGRLLALIEHGAARWCRRVWASSDAIEPSCPRAARNRAVIHGSGLAGRLVEIPHPYRVLGAEAVDDLIQHGGALLLRAGPGLENRA